VWRTHLDGRVNAIAQLWPVLMFQAWHAAQHAARQPVAQRAAS
jgi:hypothetical protein